MKNENPEDTKNIFVINDGHYIFEMLLTGIIRNEIKNYVVRACQEISDGPFNPEKLSKNIQENDYDVIIVAPECEDLIESLKEKGYEGKILLLSSKMPLDKKKKKMADKVLDVLNFSRDDLLESVKELAEN